jgi:hypothetical protein
MSYAIKLGQVVWAQIGGRLFLGAAHWLALLCLFLSLWSGLNLALDQRPWLKAFIPIFPGMQAVSFWHQIAAVGWLALAVFYLYFRKLRQLKLGAMQSRVPASHRQSLQQIYFCLSIMLLTGTILVFNIAGTLSWVLRLIHFFSAILFVIFLIWHVVVEWRIGAWKRIAKLFFQFSLRNGTATIATLCSIFLVFALTFGALHWWQTSKEIMVPKFVGEITIDGLPDEVHWRKASRTTIQTYYGAPYDRMVPIDIHMMNDGYSLYIHAKWPDPSRSSMHLPILKTVEGWKVQQSGLLQADETKFYEDKFAVMIGDGPWDALRSVFLARSEGRGGHLMPANELVDVWHWKSVRNERFANLDDAHFGPALPPLPGQRRYPWGYASDPIIAGGFQENWAYFDINTVRPIRLPRKEGGLQTMQEQDGKRGPIPAMGLHWFETQPYAESLDTYPLGTVMPSVVWIHPNEGDRADVRAAGVWKDGFWNLEMARNYVTGSDFDKEIKDGVYLWFATFDHSQTRHTYHLRPLQLKLEK